VNADQQHAKNAPLTALAHCGIETDSSDQRSKRIRLTPKGQAATNAIYEIIQGVEAEWEQRLGPRKFAQLRRLLTQLNTITAPANARA